MKALILVSGLALMTASVTGCQDEAEAPSTNRTSADTDPVGSDYDPDLVDRPSETTPDAGADQSAPLNANPATEPETPPATTIDSLDTPGVTEEPADELPNP